jgi:1-phosphofructokinase
MIGTITIHPSIDRRLTLRGLALGGLNRAYSVCNDAGGKGINVSKVVHQLGGRTRAHILIGGICGRWLVDLIRDSGVECEAFGLRGNTRLNLIIKDSRSGRETQINTEGPKPNKQELNGFLRRLLSRKPFPDFWALSGSLPRGLPPETYARFIRALQKKGARCALDTDGIALQYGVKAKPFMIKLNRAEMSRLVREQLNSPASTARAAKRLLGQGIKLVVVSLGEQGSLFASKEETWRVRVPKVHVQNTVGCGDALLGGVLLGLKKNMPLKDAARLGAAASVSTAARCIPQLCRREDLARYWQRIQVTKI